MTSDDPRKISKGWGIGKVGALVAMNWRVDVNTWSILGQLIDFNMIHLILTNYSRLKSKLVNLFTVCWPDNHMIFWVKIDYNGYFFKHNICSYNFVDRNLLINFTHYYIFSILLMVSFCQNHKKDCKIFFPLICQSTHWIFLQIPNFIFIKYISLLW